jgi:hypothetical protein
MSWNYRIVKSFGKVPEPWELYEIHEVYYNKKGEPDSQTTNDVSPAGETHEDFLSSWVKYQAAFTEPILNFDWDNEKFVDEIQHL